MTTKSHYSSFSSALNSAKSLVSRIQIICLNVMRRTLLSYAQCTWESSALVGVDQRSLEWISEVAPWYPLPRALLRHEGLHWSAGDSNGRFISRRRQHGGDNIVVCLCTNEIYQRASFYWWVPSRVTKMPPVSTGQRLVTSREMAPIILTSGGMTGWIDLWLGV